MRSDGPIPEPDLAALRVHLAQLRRSRGMSYDALAAAAGVGRATLVALESGKPRIGPGRDPNRAATSGTLITWYRIAMALEVDLGDLLKPIYGTGEGR